MDEEAWVLDRGRHVRDDYDVASVAWVVAPDG
jgi:hypothetical protein